jgi:N-6 DNA Methylase
MPTLPTDLRNKLERTCIAARNEAERAASAALESLAVQHHEAYGHMGREQKDLRNKLRAHARQLGDKKSDKADKNGADHEIGHLAQECAYEHWHRMVFARFLAENNLLIEPEMGVAVSLDEVKELATEAKTNLWALAGRYAQVMLPEVFRPDDPVLQVPLAREDQLKLEELLDALPTEVFTASDSLGWCYQFWQTERKEQVNKAGNKIGADELPSVTQLFTEDYMVDFLLDNTLGAWWAGRLAAVNSGRFSVARCPTEEVARKACALAGVPWKYLRFVKRKVEGVEFWTPGAGTFEGWPKTAKELMCLDPCMGSGHFVVAMFGRLVALRMAEEEFDEATAVAAVIRDNLFGLEIDPRCTQIGAFNLALTAWRRVGYGKLPAMHLACSGLPIGATREEWIRILADEGQEATPFRFFFGQLYELFQKGPVLGSLINPKRFLGSSMLSKEQMNRLMELLGRAIELTTSKPERHELGVAAQGIAKAAEILAGQFTLVATNVPYLGRPKQDDVLMDYCERAHPAAKADLATCFVERCADFCASRGTSALVTPQNWLFLGSYRSLREELLRQATWNAVARLGAHAFETIGGEVVNVSLLAVTRERPAERALILGIDVVADESPAEKSRGLIERPFVHVRQAGQLENPDSRFAFEEQQAGVKLLREFAECYQGVRTGDRDRFVFSFWEVVDFVNTWDAYRNTSKSENPSDGITEVLRWERGRGSLHQYAKETRDKLHDMHESGNLAWGKRGVAINQMNNLRASLFFGEKFDENVNVIFPSSDKNLPALWAFCSSPQYEKEVRRLDQKLAVTNATLIKVPFDAAHWLKVAVEKYPHGLPKPFSSDPTQWLFNGHPKGSDQPLHVAVARLLGFRWPRQTGSSFPDCPAVGDDGLERLADADGIVCIPSVRGEEPAADRLRKLLAAAYGKDWRAGREVELIRVTGSEAGDLEEWLRNEFFEQHCDLFQQRPFVWHIWDGRKRDGFHALVNCHRLGAGAQGRRVLESLTHSYLGEWITRQKDGEKRGEAGAEERLAAALELKKRLEAIIEGEPPFDIFVRWKPLAEQAIGWEPDINDGVRMNIRPFMASDLPNGKSGAGVLRSKPGIKWDKDRGKEPHRSKDEFPWLWDWDEQAVDFTGGREFDGNRWNDCHYTNKFKETARLHSEK